MTDSIAKTLAKLACPACLAPKLAASTDDAGGMQCESCGRRFPGGPFGVPDLQVWDRLAALPEPYWGRWALSQHGSLEEYQQRSAASTASEARPATRAFGQFMQLGAREVLDVGSGTDYAPAYLNREAEASYLALDPLPVEREVPFAKVQAWGELLPLADASFDVAVLGTSLDHVICLESLFAELDRVLREDGRLYIWGAFFATDALAAGVPSSRLFERETPAESDRSPSSLEARDQLQARFADVADLRQRYADQLVDPWHAFHLPLTFLRDLHQHGFTACRVQPWAVGFHQDHAFAELFVECARSSQVEAAVAQAASSALVNLTLQAEQAERSHRQERHSATIASEVRALRIATESIRMDLDKIKRALHPKTALPTLFDWLRK